MATRKQDPTAELAKLRTRIADLQQEREQLEHAPITKAEAHDRVDAYVADRAAGWRPNFAALVNTDDRADTFELIPGRFRGDLRDGLALADDRGAVSVALCKFMPTLVTSELLKAVDAHIEEHGPGISTEARVHRLAAIATELDEIEVQEEQLIRTAEAQGLELSRRADASPAVVLGDLGEAA